MTSQSNLRAFGFGGIITALIAGEISLLDLSCIFDLAASDRRIFSLKKFQKSKILKKPTAQSQQRGGFWWPARFRNLLAESLGY